MKSWGIERRVLFVALAPAFAIALTLASYFVALRYSDVETGLRDHGATLVRQLAATAEHGAAAGNRDELRRLMAAATSDRNVAAISVFDSLGRPLASVGEPHQQTPVGELPDRWFDRSADGQYLYFHAKIQRIAERFDDPFAEPEAGLPPLLGSITLELSRSEVVARKREILLVSLFGTLIVLALGGLLARRLGSDLAEPVVALEATVERIHGGDFSARVPHHPARTLASLESWINDLASALAEARDRSASALADSEAEAMRQLLFAHAMLDAQADAGIGLLIIERGRVIYANRAAEAIFGYSADEFRALADFADIFPDEERAAMRNRYLRRAAGEPVESRFDFMVRQKSGESRPVEVTIAGIPTDGEPRVLSVFVDISARKEAERQALDAHHQLLAQKEAAERASMEKSRFLAAATHDLRQPLHALMLFAAELETSADSPAQHRLAGQITTAAGAMGELLEALLEVSRLDTADITPKLQPVELGPLLRNIADASMQSARAKGLRFTCMPTRAWVLSDPQFLARMVGNLVSNAVRYTRQGRVLVGVRPSGEEWRIEIWDTGIGIGADHLPHVFKEFYQVANAERDATKGLGLGLSIVARLAEKLHHRISVRSQRGKGSVFAITLPRAQPVARASEPVTPAFSARVLVAHEADEACDTLCTLLASWGCEVVRAENERVVMRNLDAGLDLIVSDERCLDCLAAIPAMARAQRPLLILLGTAPDDARVKRLRIDGHLPKPVRPARLRALLHHLLQERAESSGAEEEISL